MGDAVGDCFEANAKRFIKENIPGARLCHGIVINSVDEKPMSHCWIEYESHFTYGELKISNKKIEFSMPYVLDVSNGNYYRGPLGLYYLSGKIDIDKVVCYTLMELGEKILSEDSYGPWEVECNR